MSTPMPPSMRDMMFKISGELTNKAFPSFYKDVLFANSGIHIRDGQPVHRPPYQKNFKLEPVFHTHPIDNVPPMLHLPHEPAFENILLPALAYGLMLDITNKPKAEKIKPFKEALFIHIVATDREVMAELGAGLQQWVNALFMLCLFQQKVYYVAASEHHRPSAWFKLNDGKQWMEVQFTATRIQ